MITLPCDAEIMLDIAESVLLPRSALVISEGEPSCMVEVVNTAVRFYRQPSAFKLRALVEQWERERIIRELW